MNIKTQDEIGEESSSKAHSSHKSNDSYSEDNFTELKHQESSRISEGSSNIYQKYNDSDMKYEQSVKSSSQESNIVKSESSEKSSEEEYGDDDFEIDSNHNDSSYERVY